MKYTGVNHIAMVTKDIDTTIRFWRDLLCMRLILSMGKPGYRQCFFEISENDMILFFEWPDVEEIPIKDHGVPVKGAFAFDHLSFGVESDDELWEIKAKLEAGGFWVSEVIDHGFIHSIYSFDPNNIPIEFSAPVKGVDLRTKPLLKDRCPTTVISEGSEPQKGKWPESRLTPPQDRDIYPGEGKDYIKDNPY